MAKAVAPTLEAEAPVAPTLEAEISLAPTLEAETSVAPTLEAESSVAPAPEATVDRILRGGGRSFGGYRSRGSFGGFPGGGWGGRAFGGLLGGFGGRGGWGGMRGVRSGAAPGRAFTRATVSTYSRGYAPLRGGAPGGRGGWGAYGGKAILAGSVAAYGGWGASAAAGVASIAGMVGQDGGPTMVVGVLGLQRGVGAARLPTRGGISARRMGLALGRPAWRFDRLRRLGWLADLWDGTCGLAPGPAWYWRAATGSRQPIRHTCIRFPPTNIHSMTMGISMAMLNPVTP